MKTPAIFIISGLTVILLVLVSLLLPRLLFHEPAREAIGSTFLVKPYLQLGNFPDNDAADTLELWWQTGHQSALWEIQTQNDSQSSWQVQAAPEVKSLKLPGLLPRLMYKTKLTGLTPGLKFNYRLLKNKQPVFQASAQARKTDKQAYHFAVFGDLAADTAGQRKVAYQTFQLSPDMVLLLGDIVYQYGTFTEYINKYFPVYNNDQASPLSGAPLLRSTIFLSAPGNHDIGKTGGIVKVSNLNRFPDGLAYFTLWSQPLNGPRLQAGQPNTPPVTGNPDNRQTFMSLSGSRYPTMANYSFNFGNSHWLVLDGNDYMDWSSPVMRSWVEQDLKNNQLSTWRFVAFHQSPFTSGQAHHKEQRMRLLCDLFQKHKVDLVFSGHIHNYQRTYPLLFSPLPLPSTTNADGTVPGKLQLDKIFDGTKHLHPRGVIYIISGAGGARLNDLAYNKKVKAWQPYTCKLISDRHSCTTCSIDNNNLLCRQIAADGQVIDQFKIEKKTGKMPPPAASLGHL